MLGLAFYRAGRWAEAEALLLATLVHSPDWDFQVLDWPILAMVQQRLGRPGQAQRWLKRAEVWAESRRRGRPGGVDRVIPEGEGWHWHDGVILHLLLREARALIGAEVPMLPEDVFAPAPRADDDPAAPSAPLLARAQVNDPEHLNAETTALVQEGRWEEAAAAYARVLAGEAQEPPWLWFDHATLQLALGHEAAYRSACRHMLEVFRKSRDVRWLEFTAHAWALAPPEPDGRAQALELAEERASALRTIWTEHVLGLALYRAGRFAEAETLLLGSLDRDPGWDFQILDWLVLSMAQQRLGRPGEARRWLERAEGWVAARLRGRPGGVDRAIPENWHWRDGILLHLLLREARALIGADLPTLPQDVFAPAS